MKISEINKNISFQGALNNKFLLKSLKTIAEHPATFTAGTALVMSSIIRPAAISLTPKTDKENKKYAISDSISSGLTKFLIAEAFALPVENAVKNINKNPQEFLNKETIKNLKEEGKELLNSKNYNFASQLIKNAPNLISAIPKSVIGVALIPFVNSILFPQKPEKKGNDLTFKGIKNPMNEPVQKIFNSSSFQNFVKKHSAKDSNITRDITLLTDGLLALTSVISTKKSKKIEEKRKNPLIYNKLFTTAISMLFGFKADELIQKSTKSFIEKFKQANINNPELKKYIQGINILRPTLIFALIYYGFLPVISTFVADKADKIGYKLNKNN